MLVLPIKKKWFDMIASGVKREEYRDMTQYYRKRFQNLGLLDEQGRATFKDAQVIFRNGYSKNSKQFEAKVSLRKRGGSTEWGAEQGKRYFVLLIKSISGGEHENEVDDGNGTSTI